MLQPVISRSNETERRIELLTGGTLEFWTLEDPDAGRSRKYQRIVIDEAAKVRHLERAWNESIRPTLTDLVGDADFYSTPKGLDFFWRLYVRGTDREEPDWACWQRPTSDNPFISSDEIEGLRRQLPERVYRQEVLAEFIADSGGVFRKVREAVDYGRRANCMQAEPDRFYSTGIDLARIEDFTVITVVDDNGRQVYHERFNQISWERQIGCIVEVYRRFGGAAYVDSTGVGDPIFERLRLAGLDVQPYQFTSGSKERLIDSLAMQLERGNLRLMDIPEQENELCAFAYELTPSRNVRMGAPEGMHDDCVISLALASWGASGAGVFVDTQGAF